VKGVTLEALTRQSAALRVVRKSDVRCGDRIVIKTANSIYSIQMISNKHCLVSGGWFDKKGVSPAATHVAGCTWGGTAIKIDTLAACGLCIEFGNRVRTTSVKSIFVFPLGSGN